MTDETSATPAAAAVPVVEQAVSEPASQPVVEPVVTPPITTVQVPAVPASPVREQLPGIVDQGETLIEAIVEWLKKKDLSKTNPSLACQGLYPGIPMPIRFEDAFSKAVDRITG